MKKLILISLFLLSGCSLVDAYLMAKFDSNEYALVSSVKTKAFISQSECNDRTKTLNNVDELYFKTMEFKNFTLHIPHNEDATKMAEKLLKLSSDTKDYYAKNEKVSEIFCKAKYQQIYKSADEIQHVLGRKPR